MSSVFDRKDGKPIVDQAQAQGHDVTAIAVQAIIQVARAVPAVRAVTAALEFEIPEDLFNCIIVNI